MPAFFTPNSTAFPLNSTEGLTLRAFRANNAAEAAHVANAFLRGLDDSPVGLVDFALTAGGGGNVDLCLMLGDQYDSEAGFPSSAICSFVGFESNDGASLEAAVNSDLAGPDATKKVAGWSTATGAAAGKLCAVCLFLGSRV